LRARRRWSGAIRAALAGGTPPEKGAAQLKLLKASSLRIVLVLVGWIATGVTALIPVIISARSAETALIQRAETAYEIVTIWAVYRLGARVLRFPPPRGGMHVIINVVWAVFSYVIIGGSVEVMIGAPTLAAGLAGIPFGIVFYLLIARQSKPASAATSGTEHS